MTVAVTLTARDVVDMSAFHRRIVERETIASLRRRVQNVMGYLSVWGLDGFNRAKLEGDRICTEAIATLPDEQSRLFLPLAAIPHTPESFDGTWMDLRLVFDRVWNATARFDGDDEEGVSV